MITGVLAYDRNVTGGGAPVGPNLIGELDFAGDSYAWNGSSVTLASIVDLTARRSSSGLEIIAGSPVQLIGDPLTFMLSGSWTVVIEYNFTDADSWSGRRVFLLAVYDAYLGDQISIYQDGASPYATGVFFEDAGSGLTRTAYGNGLAATGIHKIASTRVTGRISGSLDGETAVTDATSIPIASWTFPPSQVQLADGNDSGTHEGYIRKIGFYDAVADADLPALST